MAITQKFYPKFFDKALKGIVQFTNNNPGTLQCTVRLHTSGGAPYNIAHGVIGDVSGALGDTASSTVSLALSSDTLSISMTDAVWATSPGTFRFATVSTTSGDHLLMHLDFGTDQTPVGQFTIQMTTPASIDLNP